MFRRAAPSRLERLFLWKGSERAKRFQILPNSMYGSCSMPGGSGIIRGGVAAAVRRTLGEQRPGGVQLGGPKKILLDDA